MSWWSTASVSAGPVSSTGADCLRNACTCAASEPPMNGPHWWSLLHGWTYQKYDCPAPLSR